MIPSVRKKQRKDVEIAITNLVDVVFVLLIFFVLTTTFTKETGVDISKPSAESSTQLAKQPVMIGISREGAIYVNERQVDLAMLQAILRREAAQDAEKSVVLVSDRNTDMGVIVDVMDECSLAGLKKVSVSTENE
jgi:biopolymer transport protein ExbD